MIQVSNEYKELMSSTIRPKCEPIITVQGYDANNNLISLQWSGQDIKQMTYKRGIDPVGRELPYMELEWTEVFSGKLNSQGYPRKYANVQGYMLVYLSFKQSLTFSNTWKAIYNTSTKWSELFSKTWKKVKNEPTQETITLPPLLLEAQPTLEGLTVKWKAYDLMHFFEETIIKSFSENINFFNPILYLLINQRGTYNDIPNMRNMVQGMIDNVKALQDNPSNSRLAMSKKFIIDSSLKDFLRNYVNIINCYWDYDSNGFPTMKKYLSGNFVKEFSKKMLYKMPTITFGKDISVYSFKRYSVDDGTNVYDVEPELYSYYTNNNGLQVPIYRADFEEYGRGEYPDYDINLYPAVFSIDHLIAYAKKPYTIREIKRNSHDEAFYNSTIGEVYAEDNPLNPYGKESNTAVLRKDLLTRYFNSRCSSLSADVLYDLSVEVGDIVKIETDLYTDNDEVVFKNAMVVGLEITYNGSFKEKITAHEVVR